MTTDSLKPLPESHKRGISSTLAMLDEMLCHFEQWAKGEHAEGILYRERNNLTAHQRRDIAKEVAAVRHVLLELGRSLGLEVKTQDVGTAIWSGCSAAWEALVELEAKHLRRYGRVPTGLAEYLDPKLEQIIAHMTRIAGAVGDSDSAASEMDDGATSSPAP